uniref:Uncharacterized protein n=1 Tax=Panagrellus redivivus TaxID=6233 RepID=A0A7E4ZZ77_PANRE
MSKLMKRSRTVDTSSATTSPSHTARSTHSGIDHLMLPPGASIIVPPDSDVPIANSSSKKQRWSFAFRKRWFSSSSSRSGRTMSQSEDLESPTNISGVALTFPQKTTLGPPSEESGDASCSAPDRPQIDPHGASSSPAVASTSAEKKRTSLRLVLLFKYTL